MRLVKPISRCSTPTRLRNVRCGSVAEIMLRAEIFSPSFSCTPAATSPSAFSSTSTRSTAAEHRTSAPEAFADASRARTRLFTSPVVMALAPALPAMRYSIVRTALLGERGAIFDPISPSQLNAALRTSSLKNSSRRSRAGRAAIRMNSRISFLPRRRTLRPVCA